MNLCGKLLSFAVFFFLSFLFYIFILSLSFLSVVFFLFSYLFLYIFLFWLVYFPSFFFSVCFVFLIFLCFLSLSFPSFYPFAYRQYTFVQYWTVVRLVYTHSVSIIFSLLAVDSLANIIYHGPWFICFR